MKAPPKPEVDLIVDSPAGKRRRGAGPAGDGLFTAAQPDPYDEKILVTVKEAAWMLTVLPVLLGTTSRSGPTLATPAREDEALRHTQDTAALLLEHGVVTCVDAVLEPPAGVATSPCGRTTQAWPIESWGCGFGTAIDGLGDGVVRIARPFAVGPLLPGRRVGGGYG